MKLSGKPTNPCSAGKSLLERNRAGRVGSGKTEITQDGTADGSNSNGMD